MKKYSSFILFALVLILLSWFVFRIFISTNRQFKQSVLYDGPIVQILEINRTPSSNEGPTPPEGVSPKKWNEEFAYRIVGEIEEFDKDVFETRHPNCLIVSHKEAPPTIYTKTLPVKEEIGQFKIGLPL